jgi:TonB family protein
MKKLFLLILTVVLLYGCKEEKDLTSPQSKQMFNKKDYSVTAGKMPAVVGGVEAIQNKIVYPAEAKASNIEGKVFLLVYIDENGEIAEAEVMKGVHPLLDKAALDALKEVKFFPGYHEGKAVKTQVALPVIFKLNGDNKISGTKASGELNADSLFFHSKTSEKDGEYYLGADKMPEIVGGIAALMNKIVYPKEEKAKGNSGKVLIAVYINEDGITDKIEISKSVNENFDRAAADAVGQVKFTPGVLDGKKVKTKIFLPIMFKLQ